MVAFGLQTPQKKVLLLFQSSVLYFELRTRIGKKRPCCWRKCQTGGILDCLPLKTAIDHHQISHSKKYFKQIDLVSAAINVSDVQVVYSHNQADWPRHSLEYNQLGSDLSSIGNYPGQQNIAGPLTDKKYASVGREVKSDCLIYHPLPIHHAKTRRTSRHPEKFVLIVLLSNYLTHSPQLSEPGLPYFQFWLYVHRKSSKVRSTFTLRKIMYPLICSL